MFGEIIPLNNNEPRINQADLSPNFDGSLVLSLAERTQDLFEQIRSLNASQSESSPSPPEITPEQQLAQLKQQLAEDKKQLKTLLATRQTRSTNRKFQAH